MSDAVRWVSEMAIISGSYRSSPEGVDPKTTIELWCRSKEGYSVLLLVQGIRPYIEVSIPGICRDPQIMPDDIDARLERLESESAITRIFDPVIKWTDEGDKPHWRVEVTQPFRVNKLRGKIEDIWTLTSADIPFINRLFLDYNLGIHIKIDGEVLHVGENGPEDLSEQLGEDYDASEIRIITEGGSGLYPVDVVVNLNISQIEQSEPFPVPWVICSFDLETSISDERILCAAAVIEKMSTSDSGHQRECFTTTIGDEETEIMSWMTDLIREHDPDIITGYNIDNFDVPRIKERTDHHCKTSDWKKRTQYSGWGRVPKKESETKGREPRLFPSRSNSRTWRLAGRCVFDAWWQARMTLRPKRQTLKFVAGLLFPNDENLQKIDVDASKMDEEWEKRPDEVMEYCLRDAELPLEILHSIQAVRRKEAMSVVAKVPFETAANGTSSQLVDSLVIRLADQSNVAVPRTNSAAKKEGQIAGGYVHDVEAGLHPWIGILDFKSMYPSIMISNNVCYTTRIGVNHPNQPSENELVHESPTGVRFRSVESRKGLVPTLLEDLMSERDRQKDAKGMAKSASEAAFHDQVQYAIKILMNTFYGVFASGFYRFTHKDLGSSITAWARHNIKNIIQRVEEEGHSVVYSDTDSIFVRAPVDSDAPIVEPEQADTVGNKAWNEAITTLVSFCNELAERFTQEGAVLEFETGLSTFFSHGAKKRYVGQVVWPNPTLIIKGYETQRTDSFDYLTEGMQKMFELVLSGEEDDAVQFAINHINELKQYTITARELVISKTCKGKIDEDGNVNFSRDYANPDSMASVKAAKKRIARNYPFTPGMKVSYVVTNAVKRPMEVEPWLEDEPDGGITEYDAEFYAKRIATAFGRITEAFNWSAGELLAGNRQSNLFSF